MKPEEILYAKTHEWVYVDRAGGGQKVATVGISHFAAEALTDLVYIELPEIGRQVKAGDTFGEVESVKAVSDLYSPVSGEVIEVNHALSSDLALLHDDPYGAGWIVKIRLADEAGLAQLMDSDRYKKQCDEEGH